MAKVDHLFPYVKQMFGASKVCYRSLAKNENRLALAWICQSAACSVLYGVSLIGLVCLTNTNQTEIQRFSKSLAYFPTISGHLGTVLTGLSRSSSYKLLYKISLQPNSEVPLQLKLERIA